MPPPLDLLTPDEMREYLDQLCADLAAAGMADASRQLQDVQGQAYTTSTEWRGELRRAARAIRSRQTLPRDLDARVSALLAPDYVERVARRQTWQVTFYASVALAGIATVASLVTLATEGGGFWAALPVGALVVLVAVLALAFRRMSVCPGCGARSQHPEQAWCAFCGMRRDSGTPGPRRRPLRGERASALTRCPACAHPPGGRSRYGRPLPSEGRFCGHCGAALPDGDPA